MSSNFLHKKQTLVRAAAAVFCKSSHQFERQIFLVSLWNSSQALRDECIFSSLKFKINDTELSFSGMRIIQIFHWYEIVKSFPQYRCKGQTKHIILRDLNVMPWVILLTLSNFLFQLKSSVKIFRTEKYSCDVSHIHVLLSHLFCDTCIYVGF